MSQKELQFDDLLNMSNLSYEQFVIRIDQTKSYIGKKMSSLDNSNMSSESLTKLLQEVEKLSSAIAVTSMNYSDLEESNKFSDYSEKVVKQLNNKIESLNATVTSSSKESNVVSKTTIDITDLHGVLKHMKSLLQKAGAQAGTNLAGVVKNYRQFLELREKVGPRGNTAEYLMGIREIEDGFKKLQAEKFNIDEFTQLPSQPVLTSQLGEASTTTPDATVTTSASAPPADQIEGLAELKVAEPAVRIEGLPVEAKVDERVLPAKGLDKGELKEQLKKIANENNWGIGFSGNMIKMQAAGNQTVNIIPTKQGMRITGSAQLGSEVLQRWCVENKFDRLDVKVSIPSVGKNIDGKSTEGDAAWKAFSNYNEKGFYVKDFPIDNFKDKPNYQQMKESYEWKKEQIAAKQNAGPSMHSA